MVREGARCANSWLLCDEVLAVCAQAALTATVRLILIVTGGQGVPHSFLEVFNLGS